MSKTATIENSALHTEIAGFQKYLYLSEM